MYIARLQVRNLRLLAEQEFSFLGPDGQPRMWTAIVGENGVCKSTILQAVALAALGPKLATAVAQDAQQFLRIGSRDAASIKASFRPQDKGSSLIVSLLTLPGRHDLIGGNAGAGQMDDIRGFRKPGWFVAGYGVGRFLANPGEVAAPQDPVVDRVEGLFDLRHKMLGLDFISVVPQAERFLRRLGRVLFAEDEYGDKLLPGLTSFEFRKSVSNPDFMVRMGESLLPVRWLSDGYKAMLAWVADLLGHGFLDAQEAVDPAKFQGVVLNRKIFAAEAVKAALWAMQHFKCCYCEGKYERGFSDVEHFRPKAAYWWLAYRFDNLYFACSSCNRPKKDRFPLQVGSRALVAEEDPRATAEAALLLDPGFDDVEEHLTFEWIEDVGYQVAPRNGSERGRWTIDVLGLDRDDVTTLRNDHYERVLVPLIRRFARARNSGDPTSLAEVLMDAELLSQPNAPFSLLAKVAFRDAGILA